MYTGLSTDAANNFSYLIFLSEGSRDLVCYMKMPQIIYFLILRIIFSVFLLRAAISFRSADSSFQGPDRRQNELGC